MEELSDQELLLEICDEVSSVLNERGEKLVPSIEELRKLPPAEAIKKIDFNDLRFAYEMQMDYDGRTYFLERLTRLDPDIARDILYFNIENDIEEFANYIDYDYEMEFLYFLYTYDRQILDMFLDGKLQHSLTPWSAMYTVGSMIEEWDENRVYLLLKRTVELDHQESFTHIQDHFSDSDLRDLLVKVTNQLLEDIGNKKVEGCSDEQLKIFLDNILKE